jgi:hypothetical protein
MFTGVYFYNNSLGFIGTSDSVLYKTTDGGTSWTWLNTGTHRTEMRSFFFESDSLGYMMCNNNGGISGILKTKDGGRTWRSERGIIENVTSFWRPSYNLYRWWSRLYCQNRSSIQAKYPRLYLRSCFQLSESKICIFHRSSHWC